MKLELAIAAVIQRRRIALGLGQRQLAERTDQYQANVSWHETGERTPSLVTLIAYAGALDCTLLELIAEAQRCSDLPEEHAPRHEHDGPRRLFMLRAWRRDRGQRTAK